MKLYSDNIKNDNKIVLLWKKSTVHTRKLHSQHNNDKNNNNFKEDFKNWKSKAANKKTKSLFAQHTLCIFKLSGSRIFSRWSESL